MCMSSDCKEYTWGSASRSVERTKKGPWKDDTLSPRLHRTLITASHPAAPHHNTWDYQAQSNGMLGEQKAAKYALVM